MALYLSVCLDFFSDPLWPTINSHSFKNSETSGRWCGKTKLDLRLKNCWKVLKSRSTTGASNHGNIYCKQIHRKRQVCKKIKAIFSFKDISCWLTPSWAHALVTLAAWSVQLCLGTWSTAWDSTSPWGVSVTRTISLDWRIFAKTYFNSSVLVFESMCESCAVIYFTDSPTRNNFGNCRLQPDGPGSRCVSAAGEQPGEDLDSGGEVQRDLDQHGHHLPTIPACQGQSE